MHLEDGPNANDEERCRRRQRERGAMEADGRGVLLESLEAVALGDADGTAVEELRVAATDVRLGEVHQPC